MKTYLYLTQFAATLVLTALAEYFFELWWMAGLIPFLIAFAISRGLVGGLHPKSGRKSFFTGFVAVGLLWLGYALYTHLASGGILTQQVAAILPFQGSSTLLILFAGVVGGLVGGLASLSGTLLGAVLEPA